MIDAPDSVHDLIARFELRRRARTDVFAAGVRLARQGGVRLDEVEAESLRATVVDDPGAHLVEITVEEGRLAGRCTCPDGDTAICLHQVAAAHALWVSDRRRHV